MDHLRRVRDEMTITIHNVTRREDAQPLVDALQGESYMNLDVGVCPVGGSFDVTVSTSRPDTSEQDLNGMVMSLLAYKVCEAA